LNGTLLLVEDEALILMDLEFAAEDAGYDYCAVRSVQAALEALETRDIVAAVLDVNLGGGETCVPIAEALSGRGIPYILHSGDLDRNDELVRTLDAELIKKPARSETVVERAMTLAAE
jgi:DNA-binding response OmpR family regulator